MTSQPPPFMEVPPYPGVVGYAVPPTDVPGVSLVPAPPPGPGVVAPFASPPRDRSYRTLWIGLGVGGLVVVLCCVAGILGGGLLANGAEGIARSQVSDVVRGYLGALQSEDYRTARNQYLCSALQPNHTVSWFEDKYADSKVVGFTVDTANVAIGQEVRVPATVTQQGQAARLEEFTLQQESSQWVICGGVD